MPKFQLPTQKGTDVFDIVTRTPPLLRWQGVNPRSPQAQDLWGRFGGAVQQFYLSQAHNYALSPIGQMNTTRKLDENVIVRYSNQFGREAITVYVNPSAVAPVTPPRPEIQLAFPEEEELGNRMIVLSTDREWATNSVNVSPRPDLIGSREFMKLLFRHIPSLEGGARNKVYGFYDPDLTFTVASGLVENYGELVQTRMSYEFDPAYALEGWYTTDYYDVLWAVHDACTDLGLEFVVATDLEATEGYIIYPSLAYYFAPMPNYQMIPDEHLAILAVKGRKYGALIFEDHGRFKTDDETNMERLVSAFGVPDWHDRSTPSVSNLADVADGFVVMENVGKRGEEPIELFVDAYQPFVKGKVPAQNVLVVNTDGDPVVVAVGQDMPAHPINQRVEISGAG